MTYLALYREWRPRTFDTVIGQEHVTRTLINALRQGKIVHAYLFSGPRGTGKTTAAKILAKALNCEHPVDYEPCNECSSCKSIDQGTAMEVLEIDAASNRGIDEIRDLREKVRLSVPEGKYKVYIIDEVHMLTTEAFNALLKTIEEPPAKVVFILATTEAQKIPLTILSRVQRFEFYRIPTELIQQHLANICRTLEREVAEDALLVIAQKSEGGLRDALSILDQCLIQDDPIGVEQVYQVLGMVGETFSAGLVDDMLAEDYGKLLGNLGEGIQQGKDPRQIIRELLEYLRQALYYISTGQVPMIAPQLKDVIKNQSEKAGIPKLLRWIDILLQGEGNLKYAANGRLASEMLLVQAVYSIKQPLPSSEEDEGSGKRQIKERQDTPYVVVSGQEKKSPLPAPGLNPQASKEADSDSMIKKQPTEKAGPVNQKAGSSLTGQEIGQRWAEVQEEVRKRKKSTHAFMLEGHPGTLIDHVLDLVFREGYSFHKDKMNQDENKKTLEEALEAVFKTKLSVRGVMEADAVRVTKDSSSHTEEKPAVVKKAEDLFGPDLVVVKKN